MKVGDKASVTRSFDQNAIADFIALSGAAQAAQYVP